MKLPNLMTLMMVVVMVVVVVVVMVMMVSSCLEHSLNQNGHYYQHSANI